MSARGDRGNRGQGLAEFAIALPAFLLILFGLLDVGRAVFAYNGVTNAAREGARLAIVNQDATSIETRAADQATALDVTATVQFREPSPNPDAADNAVCAPERLGCIAVVRVSTAWSAVTPVIGSLLGPFTMQAESQLPVEFICPNPSIGFTTCPKQP